MLAEGTASIQISNNNFDFSMEAVHVGLVSQVGAAETIVKTPQRSAVPVAAIPSTGLSHGGTAVTVVGEHFEG
eukprot:178873-Rhodomonas_salina.1